MSTSLPAIVPSVIAQQMGVSSVTTKGQVTLPKKARDLLGMGPGEKVRFVLKGNELVVMRSVGIDNYFGYFKEQLKDYRGPHDMDSAREIYGKALAEEYRQGLEESWND